jgi:hypothetical protein
MKHASIVTSYMNGRLSDDYNDLRHQLCKAGRADWLLSTSVDEYPELVGTLYESVNPWEYVVLNCGF